MSSKQVRHAILKAPRTIEIVERPRPALRRGQVRIAVEQCGVSRSDARLWAGETDERLPAEPGHEIAGRIIEATEEIRLRARKLNVGDRVAAWAPGGGGMADEAVVAEVHCVPVGDMVPFPCLAEPLARVVNAVRRASAAPRAHTVIVGGDFPGMLATMLIRDARSLIVSSPRNGARELARRLGATHAASPRALDALVRRVTDGRGADVVYEFTGAQVGLDSAARVVRPGGQLVIGTVHRGLAGSRPQVILRPGQRVLDLERLNVRAVDLVSPHARDPRLFEQSIARAHRLLEQGIVNPAKLGLPTTVARQALVERLAVAADTLDRARVGIGADTVVIGDDLTALLAVQLIKVEHDPNTAILVCRMPAAKALAERLKLTAVVQPRDLARQIPPDAKRRGTVVVVEFTGAQGGLDLATQAFGSGGKLVIAGFHSGLPTPDGSWQLRPGQRVLDLERLSSLGVGLVNAHFSDPSVILECVQRAAGLFNSGDLDPSPLVETAFPLDRVAVAFEWAARCTGKVVVTP